MTPDEYEARKKKELAIYDQEVRSAIEPRLRLLMAHLYIEYLLERYLSTKLKTTDGLLGEYGLTFEKKVRLAQAFGELGHQSIDSILKLNKLRNNLVHKFKHQTTEKEIDDFGRTLGKAYKEIKDKHGKNQDTFLKECCARVCGYICGRVVAAEERTSHKPKSVS